MSFRAAFLARVAVKLREDGDRAPLRFGHARCGHVEACKSGLAVAMKGA